LSISEIDALFRLPVDEFTAARNALAATLKKAGQADAAARVKALARPPVSAWAVNQLYWRHRKAFDALLAAGDRLRRVQATSLRAAGPRGDGLREAMEARREALAELTTHVGALLEAAGHAASPDTTRRIATTLDALATWGGGTDGPQPGRLTDDVEAPGFEALTSLVKGRGGRARGAGPSRVIPFAQREAQRAARPRDPAAEKRRRDAERAAQRAARAAAVRAAERALGEARKTAARAEAALKQAAARAKTAERKKEALSGQMEKVAAEADRARQQARRVAAAAEEAAQAVADAERALEEARRARHAVRG